MANRLSRAQLWLGTESRQRLLAPLFAIFWTLLMGRKVYQSQHAWSREETTPICGKPIEIRDARGVRLGCADALDAFAPLVLAPYDAIVLRRGHSARRIAQGMGGNMRLLVRGALDLNQASVDELTLLPRVGRSRAEAIVAYRLREGRFSSPEELVRVPGVGAKLTAELAPGLKAGP